ncbi:hypothetical protein KC726_01460 [Candidatus Woesebacteria bacterium]|nr:hypothetical protein [Candidatus Woesebacteria bacterium]
MLNKRTNILFDETTWEYLVKLANNHHTSVGTLVRQAVKKQYLNKEVTVQSQRKRAHQLVKQLRSNIDSHISTNEILEYIHEDRKYE